MDDKNYYGLLNRQKRLLLLLRAFDEFCSSNHISYCLACGSLLGAVRHKGFIPWDDDIDVFMDRVNFTSFCSLASQSNDYILYTRMWISKFQLAGQVASNNPAIDVFPIDNAPKSRIARKMRIVEIEMMRALMKGKPDFNNHFDFTYLRLMIGYIIGKYLPYETKRRLYEKVAQKSNKKTTGRIACYYLDYNGIRVSFNSGSFDTIIQWPFEEMFASIPSEYDHILKMLYGNYRLLPPENKRNPHHAENQAPLHF